MWDKAFVYTMQQDSNSPVHSSCIMYVSSDTLWTNPGAKLLTPELFMMNHSMAADIYVFESTQYDFALRNPRSNLLLRIVKWKKGENFEKIFKWMDLFFFC